MPFFAFLCSCCAEQSPDNVSQPFSALYNFRSSNAFCRFDDHFSYHQHIAAADLMLLDTGTPRDLTHHPVTMAHLVSDKLL